MFLNTLFSGSNISHTVVVRPSKYGYFNFSAAEITYQPSDDSKDIQVSFPLHPSQRLLFTAVPFTNCLELPPTEVGVSKSNILKKFKNLNPLVYFHTLDLKL
ncbi:MAG: hypothetical protein ACKE51_09535 [Methylococcaceae bacterium]